MTESRDLMISVCLITYNQAMFVGQALESIIKQQHEYTWEIIVADDNSTDQTREIINDYYSKYPNVIKLLFQPKNVGPAKNFIDLLKAAKGKYVSYLEGDDFWTDVNKLNKQVSFLEKNDEFAACFHNVSLLQNEEVNGVVYPQGRKIIVSFEDLAKGDYIKISSIMYRNKPASVAPLLNFQIPSEDTSLGLCLLQEKNAYYLNETMAAYRLHGGGTYSKIGESKKWRWSISSQKMLIDFFSFRPERFYLIQTKWRYCLQLSRAYADEGNFLESIKTFLKSVFPSFYYRIHVKEILYTLYYCIKRIK